MSQLQKALESGSYNGNLIYSVQVPHDYVQNTCFGTAYTNIIYGDGSINKFGLGVDTSIDTPNFTLNVYFTDMEYDLGYQNVYEADYDAVYFVRNENGELMVQTAKYGDKPEIHTYEIAPIHWYKVGLIENGEALKSLNVF